MARARNIKPAFFTNELLGTEDPMVSLTFLGLWCLADKDGILEDRPLRIKAELFPYRDSLDVNGYLTVLSRLGFVTRYQNGDVRYLEVLNFTKHQSPHHTEKAKGYPKHDHANSLILGHNGSLTVISPLEDGKCEVPERSDLLIPDSLIPDSLIEDSLIQKPLQLVVTPAPKKTRAVKPKDPEAEAKKEANRTTWQAYADSYFNRYGAEPVRNAKVNGLIAQLVQRLGAEEAPDVAFYYVTINDAFYLRTLHDLGNLVAKCESIRTQWATGRQMTSVTARQIENTQSNMSAAEEAKRMMREGGIQNAFLKR